MHQIPKETLNNAVLDRLVEFAAQICNTPLATLNLVNDDQIELKSIAGGDISNFPGVQDLADYAIRQDCLFTVSDVSKDGRFSAYAWVAGNTGIRFFSGIPLIRADGYRQGVLCLFDPSVRDLDSVQIRLLANLTGQILDILEMQSSLQILEHERKKFAALLQVSGDGVHIFDRVGNVVDVNSKFCDMLGYSRQEMLAMNVADWDAGFSQDALKDKVQETFNSPDIFETRHKCKDGSIIDVEISAQPVWIDNQLYLWNASRDITKRKYDEIERLRLLRIIEESQDFIGTSDLQGHIQYLNKAAKKLVGFPDDVDLSMLKIRDFHPEWAASRILDEGIPTAFRQGYWKDENALLHQDGHEIPISQITLLHRDAQGVPVHLSTIIRDISERKAYEFALQQAKESAETSNHAKSQFLANVSHELRTPLNAILGFSQILLLNQEMSNEAKKQLKAIEQGGRYLLSLITDLIDLARIETGKMHFSIEPVSVRQVVNDSLEIIEPMVRQYGIEINGQSAANVTATVLADYSRLRQVLINLLSNAIKYNRPQGSVSLDYHIEAEKFRISVTDNGKGIPLVLQKRIFNTFDRLGKEAGNIGGSGIGLVICKNIIEAMGGRIGFKSIEEQGSTFWVELNLTDVTVKCTKPEIDNFGASQTITPLYSESSDMHLLLVEDNPVNQMVALAMLNKLGYTADVIDNGTKAIEAISGNRYDLVLMDCQLPERDGFEVTRTIRIIEADSGRHTPIIAMTANAMEGDREKCFAAGMDGYIAKPFDIEHLQEILETWLTDHQVPS